MKKYIVIQGLLIIVAGVSYIAGKSLDLPVFAVVCLFALIGLVVFYVKTIILKRGLEKLDDNPTKHQK